MESFTDVWQYMPHGMCLLWQPWLVMLWAGSDALIFLAYMAIPLSLLRVVRAREDLQHRGLILLFAGFILLCGLTHLLGVVTLWLPIYPYVGTVKLLTGIVSALTAIVLFRLVPVLIAIPRASELEDANRQLRQKIADLERAEAELRALKDGLEEKVAERTEELERAKAKMAVVAREAVHRGKNLITVVTSIARQTARGETDIDGYVQALLGRLNALAGATETVVSGGQPTSGVLRSVIENQVKPLVMTFAERIEIDGPPLRVNSEVAQQIGLAVHELATNTQKYGALAGDSGDVSITWRQVGTEAGDKVVFEWSETFVSEPGKGGPTQTGFGHALLMRVVPAMLQGEAQRSTEGDRLIYRLEIPATAFSDDTTASGDAIMAARIVDADFGLA